MGSPTSHESFGLEAGTPSGSTLRNCPVRVVIAAYSDAASASHEAQRRSAGGSCGGTRRRPAGIGGRSIPDLLGVVSGTGQGGVRAGLHGRALNPRWWEWRRKATRPGPTSPCRLNQPLQALHVRTASQAVARVEDSQGRSPRCSCPMPESSAALPQELIVESRYNQGPRNGPNGLATGKHR